jgi:hypothetical protein
LFDAPLTAAERARRYRQKNGPRINAALRRKRQASGSGQRSSTDLLAATIATETPVPQQFPQRPASLPTNQHTESRPRDALVTPEAVPHAVPALLRRFARRSAP